METSRDPGKDGCPGCTGNPHGWVARDAYSYALDYYIGDYSYISTTASNPGALKDASGYGGSMTDLFNGNIAGMTTTLKDFTASYAILPQANEYQYDQLNRLTSVNAFRDVILASNEWDSELGTSLEQFTYDANGNFVSLLRQDYTSGTAFDQFDYYYYGNTNQLEFVDDQIGLVMPGVDMDDQSAGNYAYDPIGNLISDNAEGISNIEWTVYGKVKSVDKVALANGPDLVFEYGPDGQRISKKAIYGSDSTVTTYYVRDASGNIMAVYHRAEFPIAADEFYLVEHDIYGSSRLGYRQQKIDLLHTPTILPEHDGIAYTYRGYKRYELSNHLGNVLVVVSDRRKGMSCTAGSYGYYEADIISAQDYFSFGMQMPDRNFNGSDAKNLFNGKRIDEEGMGGGLSTYDYGFRIYNPALGRFLSVDPLTNQYPFYSPYHFAGNTPIAASDIDGLEPTEDFNYINYLASSIWNPMQNKIEATYYSVFVSNSNDSESSTGEMAAGRQAGSSTSTVIQTQTATQVYTDVVNNPSIAPTYNMQGQGSGVKGGRFGMTRTQGTQYHGGTDIKADVGSPVYSLFDGEVFFIRETIEDGTEGGKAIGNSIVIKSTLKNGEVIYVTYGHLKQNSVLPEQGAQVKQGEPIAQSGNTGNASTVMYPHVHVIVSTNSNSLIKDDHKNPENYMKTKFGEDGQPVKDK